jgi:hypothetical protein
MNCTLHEGSRRHGGWLWSPEILRLRVQCCDRVKMSFRRTRNLVVVPHPLAVTRSSRLRLRMTPSPGRSTHNDTTFVAKHAECPHMFNVLRRGSGRSMCPASGTADASPIVQRSAGRGRNGPVSPQKPDRRRPRGADVTAFPPRRERRCLFIPGGGVRCAGPVTVQTSFLVSGSGRVARRFPAAGDHPAAGKAIKPTVLT